MSETKSLCFDQIHPFVRYARFMDIGKEAAYPPFVPYDCRLFYTCKGCGEICIDHKTYEMSKGSLLLWQSSVPYHLLSPANNTVTYIALNFDFTNDFSDKSFPISPDITQNFKSENVLEQINFSDTPFNAPIYIKHIQNIENDLVEIEREYRHRKRYYNSKISGLLHSVLTEAARRTVSVNHAYSKQNEAINSIISYIHQHYHEELSNQHIGELFSFHSNYINNLMVIHTGLSLHQYILSIRISEALKLLETTNMPVAEIANTIGFKDICHFSRTFKNATGRNPRSFRQTNY